MSYFKGKWQSMDRDKQNTAKFLSFGKKICLYDLGSTGGTPPPFCWVMEGLDIVNFEPDPRGDFENGAEHLPIAIGPKELDTLYLNFRPTTSSLLRPHKPVVDRYDFWHCFRHHDDIFQTVGTQKVETYGLDEIIRVKKLPKPDFLKIDVQGLSLEVLETANECLTESVIGIHIEVEFLETYEGQKTFGAIHEHIYARGFEIFRLTNLCPWYYKTDLELKRYTGQDTFCDFLYFRSIDSFDREPQFWTEDRAIKAILLLLLHDLTDTAAAYLEKMDSKKLIPADISMKLVDLIVNWEEAMNFFYKDKPVRVHKRFFLWLLDASPRSLIDSIKKSISRE